jgi:hypothetical protein
MVVKYRTNVDPSFVDPDEEKIQDIEKSCNYMFFFLTSCAYKAVSCLYVTVEDGP